MRWLGGLIEWSEGNAAYFSFSFAMKHSVWVCLAIAFGAGFAVGWWAK